MAGPGESGDSDEEHTKKMLLAMARARTPALPGRGPQPDVAPFLTVVKYLRGLT